MGRLLKAAGYKIGQFAFATYKRRVKGAMRTTQRKARNQAQARYKKTGSPFA